ncbi:Ribonuclease H-like domain protein [Raphanus sativus]|nr:Ribonuclease H-like domain protein [Raphanus sativus]
MQFQWALCLQYGEYSQHLTAKDVESWKPYHTFSPHVLLQFSSGLKSLLPLKSLLRDRWMISQDGKIFQVDDIISKASAEARAWENANAGKKLARKKLNPVRVSTPHPFSCWIDGAWQESTRAGGMGWIIKNEEDAVLCRGSSNRTHVESALVAEALALRDALKQANDLQLQSLHISSDSQLYKFGEKKMPKT